MDLSTTSAPAAGGFRCGSPVAVGGYTAGEPEGVGSFGGGILGRKRFRVGRHAFVGLRGFDGSNIVLGGSRGGGNVTPSFSVRDVATRDTPISV